MKKQSICKHRSLLKRIRVLTNISIMISVVVMTSVMLVLFGQGFKLVEKKLTQYYAQQIEDILIRDSEEIEGDIVIKDERRTSDEIEKLHHTVPYLTIEVYMDNGFFYRKSGDIYLTDLLKIELNTEAREFTEEMNQELLQNYYVRELNNDDGESIGFVRVGFDIKLMTIMQAFMVLSVIPIAFIVMLVMGLIAKLITKPMLRPISQLTKQVNLLANEEFETMAPSLTVNTKSVKEVYELTLATNRLLNKMLNYNEVITQSEKMASVGQLTAAITHEINTPLGAINANVNMIKLLLEAANADTAQSSDGFDEIKGQIMEAAALSEEACARIDKIVRSLKLYTRIDQADFMPADINESVKSVVVLTTNLHKNRLVIHEKYGEIPQVYCHIGLMNQVFMNIFINAIQSIEKKGEITLTTFSDQENVYVAIADTGCGISPKNIYNIFQYGFTTKQPGSGSGIGLALSNNIIKKHNGSIAVESIEGEGSTFTVTIPIKQQKPSSESR